MRLLVAAEEVLDRRAEAGDLRAHLELVRGQRGDRLHHRVAALLQAPGDGAVERPGGEQRDATGRVGALRQQPQRRREPVPRRGGRAGRRRLAGLGEQRDRALVAGRGRLLDVAREHRRRRSARLQRRRGAGVRREPPSQRRRLVHGPAQDRVAEAQAPRHVGRPDQVAREQHVERVQRGGVGLLGDRDREVELERLADERAGARAACARRAEGRRARPTARRSPPPARRGRRAQAPRPARARPRRSWRAARGRTGCPR